MRPRKMLYAFTRRLLRFGVFGLVADAKPMRPAVSAMEEARKGSLGFSRSTITAGQTTLEGLEFPLQPRVGRHANHLLEAEKLAEFHRAVAGQSQRQRAV